LLHDRLEQVREAHAAVEAGAVGTVRLDLRA